MVNAIEAFNAVSNRQRVEVPTKLASNIDRACAIICEHINSGWLGVNLSSKMSGCDFNVQKYLLNLGYKVDKDFIVYWMFNPLKI